MGGRDEQQFFRELYDRTYERLVAFVMRRIPDDAADVVSDTYLAVWRRIADVPRDPSLADAWVFGTARRVLANTRRSRGRRGRLRERLAGLRENGVETAFETADDGKSRVEAALAQLTSAHREVLVLALWDELTTEQIAVVLGCSKNAAALRLMRARHAFRDAFEAVAGADPTGSDPEASES